jgi:hypothetical protein
MRNKDFSIRLLVIPSRKDRNQGSVRATLRLRGDRRFNFTAKPRVNLHGIERFDSTGRPFDVDNYDRQAYLVLRGIYMSLLDSVMELLYNANIPPEQLTRAMIQRELNRFKTIWNTRFAKEGVEI